jgi:hypothetical protein
VVLGKALLDEKDKRNDLVLFENESDRTIINEYFNCRVGQKRRSSQPSGISEYRKSFERETVIKSYPHWKGRITGGLHTVAAQAE